MSTSDLELAATEAFDFLRTLGFERVSSFVDAYQHAYQSERVRVRLTYDPRGELDVSVEEREGGEPYYLAEIADALGWPSEAAPFIWLSRPDKLAAGAHHLADVLREHGLDLLTGDAATFARLAEAVGAKREAWTRFYAGEGPDPRARRLP